MEITLEKIDIIRDRSGVSYKEAREALEAANGNVVDALIHIEESGNKNNWTDSMTGWTESISVKGNEAVEKLKTIVKSGNVSRIRVKKDDYIILDIPITAGAIGAVIIPQLTAIGAAVALLSKCTIEVERPNKEVINVSDVISNTAENITSKIKNVASDFKKGGHDAACQNDVNDENLENYTYTKSVDFDTTIDNQDNTNKQ